MQYHQIAQITGWRVVSPLEYKIKTMAELAVNLNEQLKSSAVDVNKPVPDEICPICQCDLMPKEYT